ncbi:hypothetical protein BpHYR1_034304 [Brachionus plicatilis]|uniref:Uncharacterized protein n=1 Tax=Brachionus plicatilis TaxID=10195 RepID=A0A3M7RUR1_BRAPC|nr:hypothetical protein BpHYR1_034304 [Brachionus plicatilis]
MTFSRHLSIGTQLGMKSSSWSSSKSFSNTLLPKLTSSFTEELSGLFLRPENRSGGGGKPCIELVLLKID